MSSEGTYYTLICYSDDGNGDIEIPMHYKGDVPLLYRRDVAEKRIYLRMTVPQANALISELGDDKLGAVMIRTLSVMDIGTCIDLDPTLVRHLATKISEEIYHKPRIDLNKLYLEHVDSYRRRNI